jgi:hypothetical protein
MIRWINYQVALARAVAVREAIENQNKLDITKAEQTFRDYRESELRNGKPDDDPGILGSEAGKDARVMGLNQEIWKAERDVAEIHTVHLLREAKELGIPLPGPDKPEMWRSDRVEGDNRELLSGVGIQSVRAAIRQERKERFDPLKDRAALLFGAAGLVIAFLSLVIAILSLTSKTAPQQPTQPPHEVIE